jgi:hypothetical protein
MSSPSSCNVRGNQDGLEMNGKHQLLLCADVINLSYRNINVLKNKTEALQTLVEILVRKETHRKLSVYKYKSPCHKEV